MVFMNFNLRKHVGLTRILVAALTSTKRKKITKWSRIDRLDNEEKFQTLDEKKDGGKRKFTQSNSHSELPSKRQQVSRGDSAECYSMVEADAQLRQAL